MNFSTKNYLKINHYHTAKHPLNLKRAKNVKSFKHGQYWLGIESGKGKKI
jgi:non-canonical (house-cleaning) NTP pyrophosphatase